MSQKYEALAEEIRQFKHNYNKYIHYGNVENARNVMRNLLNMKQLGFELFMELNKGVKLDEVRKEILELDSLLRIKENSQKKTRDSGC